MPLNLYNLYQQPRQALASVFVALGFFVTAFVILDRSSASTNGNHRHSKDSHLEYSHRHGNPFKSSSPSHNVSLLAVLCRYNEDLTWLTEYNTGLYDNQSNTFILPIEIYQNSDLGSDGYPSFPGLKPPKPANWSRLSDEERLNYTENPPKVLPTWPEWAWTWARAKNETKATVAPGTSAEAEYMLMKRVGLPDDVTKIQSDEVWRKYERISGWREEETVEDGDTPTKTIPNTTETRSSSKKMITKARKMALPGELVEKKSKRSPSVVVPDVSTVRSLNIVPNRGAEAMAYLSAIIDHYDNLPDLMIFMHAHRFAWHTKTFSQDWQLRRLATHPPSDPNLTSTNGYHALGCFERWGNDIAVLYPAFIDANWKSPNGIRWHEALAAKFTQAWREHLGEAYGGLPTPPYIRTPAAASFVASQEAILRHPKRWYEDVRSWLLETLMENKILAIVMEFQTGLMFANKSHFTVSQEQCLCELYDVCTMKAEI